MADALGRRSQRPDRVDRRRELSLKRRDPKRRRLAYLLIGVLLIVVAGISIAAYSIKFVFPNRELIVRVNDVAYTRGDLVKLLAAKQAQIELLGATFKSGREIFEALQQFIETEMIATVAPEHGVTVSDEEVDEEIRRLFTPSAGDAEVAPGQLEREFADRYDAFLNDIQLSRAEFREEIRKQLLRERFKQYIGESVAEVAPQIRVHRIVMNPRGEIDLMRQKYDDFRDSSTDPDQIRAAFKAIVREFSSDNSEIVRKGGDLGWAPRGVFKEYDDLIFGLEVGELSLQVPNFDDPEQIYFFLVSEKDEARQIDPANLDRLKTKALQDWLNDERANHEVYAQLDSDIYAWMLDQLRLTTTITPTAIPNPLGLQP